MSESVRRVWAILGGVIGMGVWLLASVSATGFNVDTFGLLVLLALASPVVGILCGLAVSACLNADKPGGMLLIFVPGAIIFGFGWASRADDRARSRELGQQVDASIRELERLGWKAPPQLRRTGGGANRFSYAVDDLEATTKMMDSIFGWDLGRSRYWVKRTGSEMLWAHCWETEYSSPKVAFDLWHTGDDVLLGKMANEFVRAFRADGGRAVLANVRGSNKVLGDVGELKRSSGVAVDAPDIVEDLVVDGPRARVDVALGYAGRSARQVAFVRVHWIRRGDSWVVSKLAALPPRSHDSRKQVRDQF